MCPVLPSAYLMSIHNARSWSFRSLHCSWVDGLPHPSFRDKGGTLCRCGGLQAFACDFPVLPELGKNEISQETRVSYLSNVGSDGEGIRTLGIEQGVLDAAEELALGVNGPFYCEEPL